MLYDFISFSIFISFVLGTLPIWNKILYLEQTTQDAVRHPSFDKRNVTEKTTGAWSVVFSVFSMYIIYTRS